MLAVALAASDKLASVALQFSQLLRFSFPVQELREGALTTKQIFSEFDLSYLCYAKL